MDELKDKEITCIEKDCGTFIWTVSDQEFYKSKGYGQPKRCHKHAQERRAYFLRSENEPRNPPEA